jgi:hypothetical protein
MKKSDLQNLALYLVIITSIITLVKEVRNWKNRQPSK